MSYYTWAVTVSVRDGIPKNSPCLESLLKWAEKRTRDQYALAWEAKGGGHCHLALHLPQVSTRSNLALQLVRWGRKNLPEWDLAHDRVMRDGVKIMYNEDWLTKYLQKKEEEGDELVYNSFPDEVEYPKPPALREKEEAFVADKYITHLEKRWKHHGFKEVTTHNVACFVNMMQYKWREIKCIMCPRKLKNTIQTLKRFLLEYDGAQLWGDQCWCCEQSTSETQEEEEMELRDPQRYMEEFQ